jgi:phosphohistidine swiveling domain-containing protein
MFQLHTFNQFFALNSQQIRHQFGGKALGLYEAFQLGIAIPSTWMISAQNHEMFLKTNPSKDPKTFQNQAIGFIQENLSQLLIDLDGNQFAVRSSCQSEDSAKHSFAGIFETKLFVNKEGLAEAIAFVWSSPLHERAINYSHIQSLMGVLIQPMIDAKFSGICFTMNPSPKTVFENQTFIVEYAPTIGEKIVQGEVTPNRLCGTPDVLSAASENGWMDDLILATFEIKKRFHHEADIEFAVDQHEKFWLLQQRPISKTYLSHALDLACYKRMYKRSLLALDIEFLIEGCSKFLAPYLELPFSLEKWMVMTTSDGVQELWVEKVLNETILSHVIHKVEHDRDYLSLLEARYANHYQQLRKTDLSPFFDSQKSLHEKLFLWFEWITPFTAHYYAPMFVIEALYTSLLREIRVIDPTNAEKDLFELGTMGVGSLMDLLNHELRSLKDLSFEACSSQLKELAHQFGFMKCRQVFEDPYTPEEIYEMIGQVSSEPYTFDKGEFATKKQKYLHQEHLVKRLNHLREWIRIRNQEMEYLLFAFLSARPLINEVCAALSITPKVFWSSSKGTLLKALNTQSPLESVPVDNLTILRANGETFLSDQIQLLFPASDHLSDLRGRTVFGKGILEATVRIAFSPDEFIAPPTRPTVLVTGMTTPDFVPHIRKHFDALITDEGGILCHAAIVAREIPIPCIVGTGMGSSILKDGMRVRIDFDRGEIEKLDE